MRSEVWREAEEQEAFPAGTCVQGQLPQGHPDNCPPGRSRPKRGPPLFWEQESLL